MKNYGLMIVCLLISGLILSGCNSVDSNSMVKAQRRLEKYLPSENTAKPSGRTIDLSEGPKLRYDAKFGPKDLNFDIKIINPYD